MDGLWLACMLPLTAQLPARVDVLLWLGTMIESVLSIDVIGLSYRVRLWVTRRGHGREAMVATSHATPQSESVLIAKPLFYCLW